MYKHYLITRFNLRVPGWEHTKRRAPLLDDAWMKQRLGLFSDFCLPSVAGQSVANFQWLIFMDSETRAQDRARMDAIAAEHGFIRLRYIDGMDAFMPSILDYIATDAAGCSHIITSRIDNDDALHCDYIGFIQGCFREQKFCAIDVVDGYTLQLGPPTRIGQLEHAFNPFSSLIEENRQPQTIWSRNHGGWKRMAAGQLESHSGKRLWMSIIHDRNKANEFTGYGDVDWDAVCDGFSLDARVRGEIGAVLEPRARWRWSSLANAIAARTKLWRKMLKQRLGLYRRE
jgi:hypothetical protein